MKTLMQLSLMASDAIPTSDEDWGSERQIEAENAFFDAAQEILPPGKVAELYETAKMTTEEMVADCLERLRPHFVQFGSPRECPALLAEQQRLIRTWNQ